MSATEVIVYYPFLFFINTTNITAAISAMTDPKINGICGLSNAVHSPPAMILAGSSASPVMVAWSPSMVPFRWLGATSVTKALSAPDIIAV